MAVTLKTDREPDLYEDYRPLVVSDPPMEGADVLNLQNAISARGIATPTHGRFTLGSALACVEAQYWLGLLPDTYQRRDEHGSRLITPAGQHLILHPADRAPDQLERAKDRRGQLDLGDLFYDKLRQEFGLGGGGVEVAMRFAATHVGTRERPAGSNDGPWIRAWSRLAGYRDPVPWAGAFANVCLVAGGMKTGAAWVGYAPGIRAHAELGLGGWSLHRHGAPGDIALSAYADTPDEVVHVELVCDRLSATHYSTLSGNARCNGQVHADGGMVCYRPERSTLGALPIVAFARPPW
jgi:hypothetical protein